MTAIFQNVAANSFAIKGKGNEYNNFDRFFSSLSDANEAISTGDYVPDPNKHNAVLILGSGIMLWSFDLQEFVTVSALAGMANQASKYIELDGADDYVEYSTRTGGAEDLLDWTTSWSIGITFLDVLQSSDQKYMSLFSSGGNHILLRRGGSNYGFYVTGDNMGYSHGANAWVAPQAGDRVLFCYDHTTKYIKYYLGTPSTSTYALKANLLVNDNVINANQKGAELNIGKGNGGNIEYWDGGVNNLIAKQGILTGSHVEEYFTVGEAFHEAEYYPDLIAYSKLGEDTYPAVSDSKGNLKSGTLVNGSADDFANVPTE